VDLVLVRVIARRPDAIVDFGETRIHAETASPRPDDQLTIGTNTFVIQGEPARSRPTRVDS
jgi:hypothetical protein